jgi:transcriptional regulator with XRE-family HTH domain
MAGATLRRLRRRLGWTQVDLAVALGVTSNSVARWERDEVTIRPPIARLVRHVVATQAPVARRRRRAR